MVEKRTAAYLEYKGDVESLYGDIQQILEKREKPYLVYVNLSSSWFPRRMMDLPNKLKMMFASNPMVKPLWDLDSDAVTRLQLPERVDTQNEDVDEQDAHPTNSIDYVGYAKSINYVPKVVVAMTSWKKRI